MILLFSRENHGPVGRASDYVPLIRYVLRDNFITRARVLAWFEKF